MIIIFHCIASLLHNLYSKIVAGVDVSFKNFHITKLNPEDSQPLAERDLEDKLKFDPPVFKQRYGRVVQILSDEKWANSIKKVVEFGCAELGLFVFLKNSLKLNEVNLVDIDELLLSDVFFKAFPLNADHIVGRSEKLKVNVLVGSVSNPHPTVRETDAVVALELIEHLYPDTLEAFPYNIFSYIEPKIVLVTTPNVEFNILFDKLNKFRHADHKFEWNRTQFQEWATNITQRFPRYIVQFEGIGRGPEGSSHLGCCSQLAVFIRKDIICDNYKNKFEPCVCVDSTCKLRNTETNSSWCFCNCRDCLPKFSYGICTYNTLSKHLIPNDVCEDSDPANYKLLVSIDYPFYVDPRSKEEQILDEIKYLMYRYGHVDGVFYNFDKNRAEIPLKSLIISKLQQHFSSEAELRKFLEKSEFKIEECVHKKTEQSESCLIYESEMESSDGSNKDATEASGYESDNNQNDDLPLCSWDSPPNTPTWTSEPDGQVLLVSEGPKSQLHLDVDGSKSKQGALFDSGYQKSPPSIADEASPIAPIPLSEPPSSPAGNGKAKASHEKPQKLSNILSVFNDFDKINELDTVRRDKRFLNLSSNLPRKEVMKKLCQEIAKHPVAGPSRDMSKEKSPKKLTPSDSEESVEELKSITTCILENTLNKIECKDEGQQMGHLIQEIEQVAAEEANLQEPVQVVVENGDLANNNRDREGNNYPPEENVEFAAINNDVIDNIEANNVNVDNNNEIAAAAAEAAAPIDEIAEQDVIEEEPEVEWPSREALCDGSSHVDLLDDFDMDLTAINGIAFPNDCIIVPGSNNANDPPAALPDDNGFPNWLLQIFQDVEAPPVDDELHDEPHFYCQGDGLGVHPSTVAVADDDDDDEDDEGNESGSESSSNSGSVDLSNAQNSTSVQELFMTPEGSRNDDNFAIVGQRLVEIASPNVSMDSSENDIFENAQDSESNLSSAT